MKVIFLDNIRGIGRVGDIKEVNDGYARNFLLPRKLAKPVSTGTVKDVEQLKSKKLELLAIEQEEAQQLIARLAGTTLTIEGKANEQGTLFSSISTADIATRLSAVVGARIEPTNIVLDEHLKHVGSHTVHVRLADGVDADVTVVIQPLIS